jgi:hypothetical protein
VDGPVPNDPPGDGTAETPSESSPDSEARSAATPAPTSGNPDDRTSDDGTPGGGDAPSTEASDTAPATAGGPQETPSATAGDRTDDRPPVTTPTAPESPAPSPEAAGRADDAPPVPPAPVFDLPDHRPPPAPAPSPAHGGSSNGSGGPDDPAGEGDDGDATIVLGGAGTATKAPAPAPRLNDEAVAASATRTTDPHGFRPRITPPSGITRVGDDTGEPPARHFRAAPASGEERDLRRPLMLLAAAPVLIVILLILAWAVDSAALSGQVVRNVEVSGRPVGGLGEASLPDVVSEIAEDAAERPVRIDNGERTYDTTAGAVGLTIDEEATAEAALDAGRSDSLLVRPFKWLGSFFGSRDVPVQYAVSEGTAALTLAQLQGGDAQAPAEPSITFDPNAGEFTIIPGRNGTGIDAQQVAAQLPGAASESESGEIVITAESTEVSPQFTDEVAAELANRANEMTADGLNLRVDETVVHVEPAQLRQWIGAAPPEQGLEIAFNGGRIAEDLPALFAALPGEPVDASVTLGPDGRPHTVPAQNGVRCCGEDSAQRIWDALEAGEVEVALEAQVAEPEVTDEVVQGWGIAEPIGGSRAWRNGGEVPGPGPGFTTYHDAGGARVTNIHRMAELVRGAVIPPDGTFSINDHVGERTAAKGFVAAGAIRDGQHVDEVGGGVSQFATTMFNAAYFAGLDIETYQAHSESFPRYPPGREATMGYPNPDLVIHNNTPHGLLVWTSFTDTSLTVTFYSTPYATAEQTDIGESMNGQCRNVVTTRTRTYPDAPTETDTFQATYRPGDNLNCQGQPINPEPPPEGGNPPPAGQ